MRTSGRYGLHRRGGAPNKCFHLKATSTNLCSRSQIFRPPDTCVRSGPRLNSLQLQLHNYTIKHLITSRKQLLLLHCCGSRQLLRPHLVLIATLILIIYLPNCKRLQLCVSEKTRIFHESEENVLWGKQGGNQRAKSETVELIGISHRTAAAGVCVTTI